MDLDYWIIWSAHSSVMDLGIHIRLNMLPFPSIVGTVTLLNPLMKG